MEACSHLHAASSHTAARVCTLCDSLLQVERCSRTTPRARGTFAPVAPCPHLTYSPHCFTSSICRSHARCGVPKRSKDYSQRRI